MVTHAFQVLNPGHLFFMAHCTRWSYLPIISRLPAIIDGYLVLWLGCISRGACRSFFSSLHFLPNTFAHPGHQIRTSVCFLDLLIQRPVHIQRPYCLGFHERRGRQNISCSTQVVYATEQDNTRSCKAVEGRGLKGQGLLQVLMKTGPELIINTKSMSSKDVMVDMRNRQLLTTTGFYRKHSCRWSTTLFFIKCLTNCIYRPQLECGSIGRELEVCISSKYHLMRASMNLTKYSSPNVSG